MVPQAASVRLPYLCRCRLWAHAEDVIQVPRGVGAIWCEKLCEKCVPNNSSELSKIYDNRKSSKSRGARTCMRRGLLMCVVSSVDDVCVCGGVGVCVCASSDTRHDARRLTFVACKPPLPPPGEDDEAASAAARFVWSRGVCQAMASNSSAASSRRDGMAAHASSHHGRLLQTRTRSGHTGQRTCSGSPSARVSCSSWQCSPGGENRTPRATNG